MINNWWLQWPTIGGCVNLTIGRHNDLTIGGLDDH